MIFNTWAYYLFFLVPNAILFRLSPLRYRPRVIVAGGSSVRPNYSCGMSWNFSMGIHHQPVLAAKIVVLLGGSSLSSYSLEDELIEEL